MEDNAVNVDTIHPVVKLSDKALESRVESREENNIRDASVVFRVASLHDLDALDALEKQCFDSDRLSRRSLRHWIKAHHGLMLLAEGGQGLLGYGLVWLHKGTRLARLYSLAVAPQARGQRIATQLLTCLEQKASERGRIFMRLEVAKSNRSAIALYQSQGYRVFGEFSDYYEDHDDALRMQKRIRFARTENAAGVGFQQLPWYPQTTEFTCGPAALMMAMAGRQERRDGDHLTPNPILELEIWREATTIFMTSGHGGCHPLGLALSARKRGFDVEVYISTDKPLFTESVRSEAKKRVVGLVHQQFLQQAREQTVSIVYEDVSQDVLSQWLSEGYSVLVLISTYRLDGKKAPHWVCLTNIDEHCLYVHDPDVTLDQQLPLDCQHLPIARQDFEKMSAFGAERLRTAMAIR
ncbi:GNAT family N-acetyltransferase/peptidase C39 family protein [Pseudomaricurvus hydrocarbonicus]|uniref:GNAT family N-acetyltransferase/peptidase C39 family protein n=1 Tax=Pseudomaricurvus hydrocarbonicus TaxID=1470433 RepID=UPI00312C7FF5